MTLEEFKNKALGDLEMPTSLAKFYQFEDKHLYFCNKFEISIEEVPLDIEDEETYYQTIKPFGYTNDGLTAFWVQNGDVANSPIIFFDSDGYMRIIAKNLFDFMRILTLDVEICMNMYKDKSDYQESEYQQTYRNWLKKEFDLNPVCDLKEDERYGYSEDVLAIIEEAEKLYKDKFIVWHKAFCDIEDIYYED